LLPSINLSFCSVEINDWTTLIELLTLIAGTLLKFQENVRFVPLPAPSEILLGIETALLLC